MTIEYEKEPCGRCGGSGQYSWNSMHGSTCYGCSGSGMRLTKRGKAARAFADTLLDIRIEDFAETTGRRAVYRDALSRRKTTFSGAREVESSWGHRLPDGSLKMARAFVLLCRVDGEMVETPHVLGAGIKVRMLPIEADDDAIMAYQANLTKAGKPRKGVKK